MNQSITFQFFGELKQHFALVQASDLSLDQLAELSAAQLKQWLVKQMLAQNTMGTELLMHSAVAVNADILQDHEPLRPYILKVTQGVPLEIALLPPVSGG